MVKNLDILIDKKLGFDKSKGLLSTGEERDSNLKLQITRFYQNCSKFDLKKLPVIEKLEIDEHIRFYKKGLSLTEKFKSLIQIDSEMCEFEKES